MTTHANSIDIYIALRNSGTLSKQRLGVCEMIAKLKTHPGKDPTAREIADRIADFDARPWNVNSRLSELVDRGVVAEKESRECRITGARAATWALTGNTPKEAPKKPTKMQRADATIQQLKTQIFELEKENAQLRGTLEGSGQREMFQ